MGKYNFIARNPIPHARETSYLASPLNLDSRAHQWKRIETALSRVRKLNDQSSQIRQQFGIQPNAPGVVSGFHPFKIYPPSPFWQNSVSAFSAPDGTSWRRFRVRNGLVCTAHAKGIDVTGTDGIPLPYDEYFLFEKDGITPITDVQEYVVNLTLEFFYFWVEVYTSGMTTLAALRYGPDPTVSSYTDPDAINPPWTSTNPWVNWDVPDSTHFLIGWADTMSQGDNAIPICLVRQLLVTDILVSSVGNQTCPYG